jgi:L-ascorbate metabolism protein UlaG (beta-lactamase superfamily)
MFGGRGRALAAHKFVTGTPFVVDGFTEGPKPGRLYFLTHFHADHYGGLSRRWAEASQNKIFCSAITARLVVKRLGVPESKVERLPMGAEVPVCVGQTRATVQLVDANHCPGAVLLIFRLAGGKVIALTNIPPFEMYSPLGPGAIHRRYTQTQART